ncbi:hypothetical protein [Nitrosomonas sp. Nm166]|uniref:hypothetical protein n=1 Tax=Nitrosomonas sp. Nm166 TaxID=1881054 RepID=UPI0008EEC260|nr:hypothetical protein [Nitrosomonas sp. Nm166]SFE64098.1 hypothetical protein SAMN05428977_102339 [Nitrosomonas sp. Nm166]
MIQFKKLLLSLIATGMAILLTINYAVSESHKLNKVNEKEEYHSLSAPSSDSPNDKSNRRDYTEGNLSAPPPPSGTSKNLTSPTSDEPKKPADPSSHPKTH